MVSEDATFTWPEARDAVVIVRVAGAIVSVRFVVVAVCAGEAESVTLKVSGVAFTVVEGVPLMSPLDAFRVKPVGNVPADNCHVWAPVPPVAARVCEYATPTCPLTSQVGVIVSGAGAIVSVRFAVET